MRSEVSSNHGGFGTYNLVLDFGPLCTLVCVIRLPDANPLTLFTIERYRCIHKFMILKFPFQSRGCYVCE